jgi:hypothetical protein
MPKGSQFDDLARKAAESVDVARAAGQQLELLPVQAPEAAPGARAPRGQGKVNSQLREWCVAKGFKLPEEQLIQMAGMASSEDVFIWAMQRCEQILAWAEAGARQKAYVSREGVLHEVTLDTSATMAQRVTLFTTVYAAALKAADSLLPYGLGKVTPDAAPAIVNQIMMPASAPAPKGPEGARDVTPQARRIGPPNAPGMLQQNQQVSDKAATQSDAESRT